MIKKIENIKKIIPSLYDVEKNSIRKCNTHNELFLCHNSVDEYILRITNYKSVGEQIQEAKWLHYLYCNGINVSYAILSKNGKAVEEIILNKEKMVLSYLKKHKVPLQHLINGIKICLKNVAKLLGKCIIYQKRII